MKIGNGSLLEFILALFFISVGLSSSTNIYVSVFAVVISLIVIIHSIYLLIKKIKSKNNNDKTSKQEKNTNTLKPKMVHYVILIISLILNVIFISSLAISINKYTTNNNKIKEFKKCIDKIKFNTNYYIDDDLIWNPATAQYEKNINSRIWTGTEWINDKTDYFLDAKNFNDLEKCYKLLDIKIKNNDD